MQETKRLVRPKEGRMFLGVCAGLGSYFNIDPNIVRVGFVLISLGAGGGLILYLIIAAFTPSADF